MNCMQTTDTLLMIEPISFGFNEETAKDNYFQINEKSEDVQEKALAEFRALVNVLREHKIKVITIKDTISPHTPDSIYPNNWITLQRDGNIVLYPMYAQNRRWERRNEIIEELKNDFYVKEVVDLSASEKEGQFLEGTGSMIFDHDNKIAYGSISERLDEALFENYCNRFDYQPVAFHAYQTVNDKRLPIYHTNVMMSVAKEFVVICWASIDDKEERKNVADHIAKSGKQVLEITEEQMHQFAGNMLQVKSSKGNRFMVMSNSAYDSLLVEQIKFIESYSQIIHSDLSTIEKNGGGSARCMIAEVFLRPS